MGLWWLLSFEKNLIIAVVIQQEIARKARKSEKGCLRIPLTHKCMTYTYVY